MQRARRLASIAVIAVAGVLALSGCRSEPGIAAYVGDRKFTEDEVTRVVDGAKPLAVEQPQEIKPPSRSLVVSVLVLNETCTRLAADKGYQPRGQVAPEQIAEALAIDPASTYVRRTADLYTCLSGLPAGEPTAGEVADLVARWRAAGVIPAEVTDDQVTQQLQGDQQVRGALANRKTLGEAADDYDVTVNPRYRPLEFPLLTFQRGGVAVAIPLGEGDPGTVVDAR